MINSEIESRIQDELDLIEREERVQVIYACESGSRAWGFASKDSDYDVRFLYVRPTAWYLTIFPQRDVIEKPITDELDISGWDLPKALGLFRKSNPPLLEWLQSPHQYREKGPAIGLLRTMLAHYYSPRTCAYHYLHMARGNNRQYLQGEVVWLKKYLYVLRPVLGCLWIENEPGPVPTEFQVLVDRLVIDPELKQAIATLLEKKAQGDELSQGPKDPIISNFLNVQLDRLSASELDKSEVQDMALLDEFFQEMLLEYNGPGIR